MRGGIPSPSLPPSLAEHYLREDFPAGRANSETTREPRLRETQEVFAYKLEHNVHGKETFAPHQHMLCRWLLAPMRHCRQRHTTPYCLQRPKGALLVAPITHQLHIYYISIAHVFHTKCTMRQLLHMQLRCRSHSTQQLATGANRRWLPYPALGTVRHSLALAIQRCMPNMQCNWLKCQSVTCNANVQLQCNPTLAGISLNGWGESTIPPPHHQHSCKQAGG